MILATYLSTIIASCEIAFTEIIPYSSFKLSPLGVNTFGTFISKAPQGIIETVTSSVA